MVPFGSLLRKRVLQLATGRILHVVLSRLPFRRAFKVFVFLIIMFFLAIIPMPRPLSPGPSRPQRSSLRLRCFVL